uniref:Cytochrome b561 domain-containing protein n=1 Tax=Attheya septentrionalis TaxID=420275 RepID=A0A7S2UAW4_9STRA
MDQRSSSSAVEGGLSEPLTSHESTNLLLPEGNREGASAIMAPSLQAETVTLATAQQVAGAVAHFLSLAVLLVVSIWVFDEGMGGGGLSWKKGDAKRVFNWHPLLMITAFSFMTVASLAFRPSIPRISTFMARSTKKLLHGIEWTVAALSATVGLVAVVQSHNDAASGFIANLYSLHSWVGVFVIAMYLSQFAVGTCAFALDIPSIFTPAVKANVVMVHRFVGQFVYNLTAATILLGIQEKEGFIGCNYTVTKADTFPIQHFFDIPKVCRIGHFIGILVVLTTLCTNFALYSFEKAPHRNR